MTENLRVGDLAERAGKTIRTIRYYQELGILEPTEHTSGGHCLYSPSVIDKIKIVDRFRTLGFSLEEIASIIRTYRGAPDGDTAASRLLPLLDRSLDLLNSKVNLLESFRRELKEARRFIEDCLGCKEHPDMPKCGPCTKGDHEALPPIFMRILLKRNDDPFGDT